MFFNFSTESLNPEENKENAMEESNDEKNLQTSSDELDIDEPSKKKGPDNEPDSQSTEVDDFSPEANQNLLDQQEDVSPKQENVTTVNTIPLRFLHHESSMELESDEDEEELYTGGEGESEEINVTSTNKKLPFSLFSW